MTEFAFLAVLENLVRQELIEVDRPRLNELAITIRLLLIEELKGKDRFHKLSLILKLSIIRRMLLTLTSVFLRYFKAEWKESE